nr:hypothetical protein CFP56_32161 [Quercus suber]
MSRDCSEQPGRSRHAPLGDHLRRVESCRVVQCPRRERTSDSVRCGGDGYEPGLALMVASDRRRDVSGSLRARRRCQDTGVIEHDPLGPVLVSMTVRRERCCQDQVRMMQEPMLAHRRGLQGRGPLGLQVRSLPCSSNHCERKRNWTMVDTSCAESSLSGSSSRVQSHR